MLQDLDNTLKELLQRGLSGVSSQPVAVSFAAPGGDLSVTTPTIDLFLYEIVENRDLRSRELVEIRLSGDAARQQGVPDGTVLRTHVPLRVDCHYLVTAWAQSGDVETEHRLLGHALRALLRHREVPPAFLQGSMKSQPVPVRTTAVPIDATRPRGEFWHALGGKPRASFDYRVTICIDAGDTGDLDRVAWESVVERPPEGSSS